MGRERYNALQAPPPRIGQGERAQERGSTLDPQTVQQLGDLIDKHLASSGAHPLNFAGSAVNALLLMIVYMLVKGLISQLRGVPTPGGDGSISTIAELSAKLGANGQSLDDLKPQVQGVAAVQQAVLKRLDAQDVTADEVKRALKTYNGEQGKLVRSHEELVTRYEVGHKDLCEKVDGLPEAIAEAARDAAREEVRLCAEAHARKGTPSLYPPGHEPEAEVLPLTPQEPLNHTTPTIPEADRARRRHGLGPRDGG